MPPTQQFSCLYTKHKTQKRRVWHDGRLVVSGGRARLFSAEPTSADPLLDECDFSESKPMETEKFLIQIEGPWVQPTMRTTAAAVVSSGPSTNRPKILGRKFQPPQRIIPPLHRLNQSDRILGKRKRPLQPGELEKLHYGSNVARLDSASRSSSCPAGSLHNGNAQSLSDAWPNHDNSIRAQHHGTGGVHSLQTPPPQQQQHHHPTPLVPSGTDSLRSTDQESHRHSARMTANGHVPLSTIPLEGFHAPQETGPSLAQPDRLIRSTTRTGPTITPDAFVLQPTKINPPRLGSLPFVSNNFNEREYYGFEEEEEEEAEEKGNVQGEDQEENTSLGQRPIRGSCHQFSTQPPRNTAPAPNQTPILAMAPVPNPVRVPAPTVQPKSTNDLFALFGTVPLILPATRQETTTTTTGSSHPTIQSVDTDQPSKSPDQDTAQLQFYLPSPTNSEDSDQDER